MEDKIIKLNNMIKNFNGKDITVNAKLLRFMSNEDEEPVIIDDCTVDIPKIDICRLGSFLSCEFFPTADTQNDISLDIFENSDVNKIHQCILKYAEKEMNRDVNNQVCYNIALSIMWNDNNLIKAIIFQNLIFWQVGINGGLKVLVPLKNIAFTDESVSLNFVEESF